MAALVLSFAGALGGGLIDGALFGGMTRKNVQGPRLADPARLWARAHFQPAHLGDEA